MIVRFILLISVISSGFIACLGQLPTFNLNEDELKSPTVRSALEKDRHGDTKGAFSQLDKAIAAGEVLNEAYRIRANRKKRIKDYAGSLADLDSAIKEEPTGELFFMRALLKHTYIKDDTGALLDLELAQKSGYRIDWILYTKAGIKIGQKDNVAALSLYDQALRTAPENSQMCMELAWFLIRLDQPKSAITRLDAFLQSYLQKYGKLPQVKGEKVVKDLESFATGSGRPLVSRHTVQQTTFNSMKESEEFTAKNRAAHGIAELLALRGSLYAKTGDISEALLSLQQAIDVDRNYDNAYASRGILFLNRNEPAAAIKELDNAIKIADEPEYYFQRCIAYVTVGNEEMAKKDLERYAKLNAEGRSELEAQMDATRKRLGR